MLTMIIKQNDEITLKYNLERYVPRIQGCNRQRLRLNTKEMCKDPQYFAYWYDLLYFRGKQVVVTWTNIKHRLDKIGEFVGNYHYINVMDRAGHTCEFPIEFIDKSCCLKRDHHIMSLHNKILIVA
jgi:hypothetical protein